jgi:hypothetical protein
MKFVNFLKPCAIIFMILTWGSPYAVAQNNCPQTLKRAQSTYDEGRISEVQGILEPCLEDKEGFTKDERIAAYKLLTLTSLYFNERTDAEKYMHQFLSLNPEYEINESLDPVEFINLYNSFRTTPVMIFGLKIGANLQLVQVTKHFSVDNSAETRGSYRHPANFQAGAMFEFPLRKKWSLLTELNFVMKSYTYSDKILGFADIQIQEKQTMLELPVLLHLNLKKPKSRFTPYLNMGPTFGALIGDRATVSRKDNLEGTLLDVPGPQLRIMSIRHTLQYYASIGVGFKLKNFIGNGYLWADFRYNHGLRNVVKPEMRTSNIDLVYNYLHIDNDFRMHNFVLSLGYALPHYKPKIKKVKVSKKEADQ